MIICHQKQLRWTQYLLLYLPCQHSSNVCDCQFHQHCPLSAKTILLFLCFCFSTYSQNAAYISHCHLPCCFLLVFTFLQVNLNHVTLLHFFVIILLHLFEKCFLLAFSKDKLHLPWILTVRSRLLRNACNLFFTGWVCVSMHKSIEGRPGCSHRAGEKVGPYPTYMHRIKLFSTAGITWWDYDFPRTLRVTVKPLKGDKVAWWLGYYSLIQEV